MMLPDDDEAQPDNVWRVLLVFSRDREEVIELPPTLSMRALWRWVRENYPGRCSIRVLHRPPSKYWRKNAVARRAAERGSE